MERFRLEFFIQFFWLVATLPVLIVRGPRSFWLVLSSTKTLSINFQLRHLTSLLLLLAFACLSRGQSPGSVSKVWVADRGDGTYKNPVLHADYSDPDVIRVGDDYYLTASSFNTAPGLPLIQSKDLVNWRIVSHVFIRQQPVEIYNKPQHGNGVWAPSIRFHEGEFYIYYSVPDYGIYLTKARDPLGPWSEPMLVKQAKGWIDPCPLWGADGNSYLINAMAASRSGVKSILVVSRMSADGTKLLDEGALVFDGHDKHPTVEGPKFYQRNGYYYILRAGRRRRGGLAINVAFEERLWSLRGEDRVGPGEKSH